MTDVAIRIQSKSNYYEILDYFEQFGFEVDDSDWNEFMVSHCVRSDISFYVRTVRNNYLAVYTHIPIDTVVKFFPSLDSFKRSRQAIWLKIKHFFMFKTYRNGQ